MPLRSAVSRVPQHWIVCVLCSLALAIVSYKNTCFLAISSVVMSLTDPDELVTSTSQSDSCQFLFFKARSAKRQLPFDLPDVFWNPWTLLVADFSFHTSRLLWLVPAGVLSDLGHSRHVLGGGVMIISLIHLIHPTTVQYGVVVYAIENFLEGVGDACIYPSVVSLMCRWTTPSDRNLLMGVVLAGNYCGYTLGYAFYNSIYVGFSSWSFGQYVTGVVGLAWVVLCFIFVYNSPKDSPFIPHDDSHINFRRKSSLLLQLQVLRTIPWRNIASSPPFLSLVLAFCSLEWAFSLNIDRLISDYQTIILNLPETFSSNSSMAIIVVLPALLIGGFLADWIITHNVMSKTSAKRTFVFVSVLTSSLLLVSACCLAGCNVMLFWILSIAGYYVIGFAVPVLYAAPIDLTTRHAGLLISLIWFVLHVLSLFDGKIEDLLITDDFDVVQWQKRSIICTIIAVALTLPFLYFGSVEKQIWRASSLRSIYQLRTNQTSVENQQPIGPQAIQEPSHLGS